MDNQKPKEHQVLIENIEEEDEEEQEEEEEDQDEEQNNEEDDEEDEEDSDIEKEIEVMKAELDFILESEVPKVNKNLNNNLQLILKYLTGDDSVKKDVKNEKINLLPTQNIEGMKCTLTFNFNELKNIEISYKPSPKHNNYIYKSKEESSWILYQVTNTFDLLKSLQNNIENMSFNSIEQAIFNVDKIFDSINSIRNILLFPKKRTIPELQSQKNMKIFPLVPNDLVFSFYIQGYKLLLAIYMIKGNESTKHILECASVDWLNNVIVLLTNSLQILQKLKDKLIIFEPISFE